jgi:hypothetical protein
MDHVLQITPNEQTLADCKLKDGGLKASLGGWTGFQADLPILQKGPLPGAALDSNNPVLRRFSVA